MKTLLFVFLLLASLGLMGFYYWRNSAPETPTFRTVSAARGPLVVGVGATGSVEPVDVIDVGAQIIGMIQSFGPDVDRPGKTIDYCSRVTPGAVLAKLDDRPQQAELKQAKANESYAEAEVAGAAARLKKAERLFERAKKLRDTNSAADFENAEAEHEIAQAELRTAAAKLEQAKAATEQAKIKLDYTTIKSRVDGVLIVRKINVGQTVVAGLNAPSLFLIAKDLSRMHVMASVNEADIGDIHVGQAVTFKVDAYRDRTFSGKVTQIRDDANMSQNVVMYTVVVDVDNADRALKPYMTAKLQFEVARRTDALLIPNQAIRWRPTWAQISPSLRDELKSQLAPKPPFADEQDAAAEATEEKVELASPAVWVVSGDGFVRPVKVQSGLSNGLVTEIIDGKIGPSEKLVVNVVRDAQPDFVSGFISKVTKVRKR